MFGLISKKKFINAVETLLRDSADNNKATDKDDLYWRFGNANAVNYICHRVGVDSTALEKKIKKGGNLMGVAVLILGESGSGKSASLRNFKQEDVGILNVASKPLPFRNVNKLQSMNKATYASIKGAVCSGKKLSWVVDDAQYLMAFESFDKVNEVGYGKFTTMAKNYEDMLRVVQEDTSPDTIVYIMQHIDTDENGKVKAKTLGKMLDQQLTVEGLFSIVLLCKADERKHYFITQSDGSNPCKSPMGMFDSLEIDNDLKMVDDTIREYYGLRKASAPKAKSTTPAKKAE